MTNEPPAPAPTSAAPASDTAPLYSPARVRELLAAHGLKPTKSLGQNFLIDGNILRSIAEAGGAAPGENVLEIGPGLGVLTREVASRGARVTALEKDERLRPVLAETLAGLDVNVVWGDALDFDYAALPAGTRVIANLPYYITGLLLTRFMQAPGVVSATVLVQKEVAQRLAAKPGQDNYGFLSAVTSLYGSVKHVRDVPKGAFFPAPDVTSSVVRLDFDRTRAQPDPAFVSFVDNALRYRRKTLRNNLRMMGHGGEAIDAALASLGLRPDVRAEDVPLSGLRAVAVALGVVR
ncbi:16S rRNA (adenine(1518)-N(6)/adenine(1519)-N(6))-dimethyltransferase RsmA [Deinococcus wulumuqiensis]|uniref:Ribosomal RNA small subunit methyltransferase A n=1 Tax=Deinococcus wulumuqiensis TaxID=980427 RepID=A0AAV4K738_9DEIO|nr:16S rRNA (adenine(1518)-N(6)/adenine(1519)-N(6))-dimethyltransferase RsmA [Deinococcus wulumuqiensis]QII19890.1 16S rRNA (adenine(1518)-N(6)/adenine(1519)-N(6))-dimethyltransferase RsmA [Deinococcus wulumuqiensis R12]GGI74694.1 ribosomal RNA small subunit methyltransferase A [Deinococcus wulumuqiensis]GGP29074.1 ribosomal RNA small subunit methyltransferase A [Deinococcus wulumuqiensis]